MDDRETITKRTIHTAEVVRAGEKLILPDGWSADQGIEMLSRIKESEEQRTIVSRDFQMPPWEVAHAVEKALKQIYGFAVPVEGRHQLVQQELSPTESVAVTWGWFNLPYDPDGRLVMDFNYGTGGVLVVINTKGKHRLESERLLGKIGQILSGQTLLGGRTFRVSLWDDDGEKRMFPKITPFVTSAQRPMFAQDIEELIDAYVLTPLRQRPALKEAGINFRSSILAAGPYGTGKTMLAAHVAHVAQQNKTTFIYVENADEYADALRFAAHYTPAVVFVEDIDRIAGGEARTDSVNEIINLMDGVDTKNVEIMTILTSNHPERLNKAMVRPGRIDRGLTLLPPDAATAVRLVKHYLGHWAAVVDFAKVGVALEGRIPAAIREIADRAKLATIARTGQRLMPRSITPEDVLVAARQLKSEESMFTGPQPDHRSEYVKAAEIIGAALRPAVPVTEKPNGHKHDRHSFMPQTSGDAVI